MIKLSNRVNALEARQHQASDKWHQLVWGVGQSFDEMIAANDAESIPPADNIIMQLITPVGGDPVRERDRPLYDDWCASRALAVSIVKPA
jgi:hypothetical protein